MWLLSSAYNSLDMTIEIALSDACYSLISLKYKISIQIVSSGMWLESTNTGRLLLAV